MTVRFLADENLRWAFIAGVGGLEPRIDLLDVKACGLRGAPDPMRLEIASRENRIVLSPTEGRWSAISGTVLLPDCTLRVSASSLTR